MTEAIEYEWIAIFLAAVAYMAIGAVWYSEFLFGPICRKLSTPPPKPIQGAFGWSALSALTTSFFLAFFEGYLDITTVTDGMFIALCLWLGFIVPTQLAAVIWKQQSTRLFFIDTSYRLVALLTMGGLLGA